MSWETLGAEEEKKNQRLSVNEEEQREAPVCYDSFIVSGVDTRNDDTDGLDILNWPRGDTDGDEVWVCLS